MKALCCPYCGSEAVLVNTKVLYGIDYGNHAYVCKKYPACNSYVLCHRGTIKPLGVLANKKLRKLRMALHNITNEYWFYDYNKRTKSRKRKKMYKRLAYLLNIPVDRCHIGLFDESTCNMALIVLQDYKSTI